MKRPHVSTLPLILAAAIVSNASAQQIPKQPKLPSPGGSATTLPGPSIAGLPTQPFAPVQAGPVKKAKQELVYQPGRVLVKLTESAHAIAALPKTWNEGKFEPFNGSGLLDLDARLFEVGATGVRRSMLDPKNTVLAEELGLARWYAFEINASVEIEKIADALAALPEVESAGPDWRAFPMDVPNDPMYPSQWGHNNTGQLLDYCWNCGGHPNGSPVGTVDFDSNVELAWDGPQGHGSSSVVVAIIDTGVDSSHPDLVQVPGYDFGDFDADPNDDCFNSYVRGHGTACAGVTAAIRDNGIGVAGVAGDCSIMPLKVATSSGSLTFSAVANALIFAADNGADVASLSLGAMIADDFGTSNAIAYAHASGVTILASTANGNASSLAFPANHQLVIGVGAASPCGDRKRSSSNPSEVNPGYIADPNGYTCDGERWWGSNYGVDTQDAAGAVDVIAPTILPTTDVQGSAGYDPGGYSMWFNGTSCSAPYAAGVCALILSADSSLSPDAVRDILVNSAEDVVNVESVVGWDRYSGYGMVNAAAAIAAIGPPAEYAPLPYCTGFESGLDEHWTTSEGAEGRVQVTGSYGPFEGTGHLTMDDENNAGQFSLNRASLHLDLAGETQVELTFRWKDFGDETHPEDGVFFSDDGGLNFVKVLDIDGQSATDDVWNFETLDVDILAMLTGLSLNSSFVVKFQQYDDYPIAADGLAFDNICVTDPNEPPPGYIFTTIPYCMGFEDGVLDPHWIVSEGVEGRIEVSDENDPIGRYHLAMDDETPEGAYSLNEAELRVNLAGEDEVALSFKWKEFGDETHPEDGVFLSDNNGLSYVKVYDFNGTSTLNGEWQEVLLDLDLQAEELGLNLNSTFVIKFQQYDNFPIATDGICIDDICVKEGKGDAVRAKPGYKTSFESGSFDAYWTSSSTNDGQVQITTGNGPAVGAWHMTMDVAGWTNSFSTNEASLRCDFSDSTQATLNFRWKDFSDETQSLDGVYFSDDDGSSFVKVYDFNGSVTPDGVWQSVALDIDALAAMHGLSLNGLFVIRFQQFDNFQIPIDGIAIDQLSIL